MNKRNEDKIKVPSEEVVGKPAIRQAPVKSDKDEG